MFDCKICPTGTVTKYRTSTSKDACVACTNNVGVKKWKESQEDYRVYALWKRELCAIEECEDGYDLRGYGNASFCVKCDGIGCADSADLCNARHGQWSGNKCACGDGAAVDGKECVCQDPQKPLMVYNKVVFHRANWVFVV